MERFKNLEDFIGELPKYLGMCQAHPSCLEFLSDIRIGLSKLKYYEDALKEGYNKAIDEFAEMLKEKWIEADDLNLSSEFFAFVEEIAEQMKGSEENEND